MQIGGGHCQTLAVACIRAHSSGELGVSAIAANREMIAHLNRQS